LPTWTNNNQNKEAQPKFAETHFELYPNPAKDEVYLQMDFAIETKVSVKIYDINGKKVVDLPETAFTKGRSSFGIPLSHFSAGLYNVVIRSENQTFLQKLVVK
jgi:hypothetical protein